MSNENTKPDHLVDVYGDSARAPDAAKFGKGTSTREGAQQAQDARRNARPGDYDSKQ
jgi:hypothetical protein